jgi:hypothetical protein
MKTFSEHSRLGSELSRADQSHVLSAYVHRYTKQHKPKWANGIWKDGLPYPVHFASDAEWLANTRFAVTKAGKLDRRCNSCNSTSTWPDNPELRIQSA